MTEMTTFASRQEQPGAPCDGDVRPSSAQVLSSLSQSRVAIEGVRPQILGGRFAVKRAVGDVLTVEADIYSDGHDRVAAALLLRREGEAYWQEVPMRGLGNDRWRGEVPLGDNGRYYFTIIAWRDLFSSWRDEISKKHGAGLAVDLELEEGRMIIEKALQGEPRGGDPGDRQALRSMLERHADDPDGTSKREWLTSRETGDLMARVGPRTSFTRYDRELEVWVDRRKAAFSAWYEMFPRSQSGDAGRHGTFADVIARLPYVRDLGFDVLYFTPIHPIGRTNRKGRNNSLKAQAGDAGSPYAIGSAEGGHDAIHPQLGTFADFERLVSEARAHDLEVALDFAIQCSPDHPWIKEHPEWFDWRPDGTIKFAENPPKKYEDIVNVHFYREAFPAIWYALRDIVLFWSERGVRIFRVDNPHTKPFPFWEWLIRQVHGRFPDVIFLSEAFTRPKPMMRLAKLGYTQSYTYFTWRNTKHELTEYLVELTRSEAREYFRPNFFVNTPDINPYYLQTSGRPGFRVRLILAATLACNYGIYNGFELCEGRPIPGKEEYLDSEKYEIKAWDWERPGHIRDDIRLINRLRRERPALQQFQHLNFYNAWNDHILYYGKFTPDKQDFVLVAVNLDPHTPQGCHFEVPLWEFGLPDASSVDVEDLVTGNRFTWTGKIQHMLLDPSVRPYAIWRLSNRQASR
jgi:starch synthase (maltosyl-transferring)